MEASDMKAMRNALEFTPRVLAKWRQDAPFRAWNEYGEAIDRCRAALSKPPRNCDVGTAEEQEKRFMHYCDSKVCNRRDCACGYEELFRHKCAIRWAQMPYKEEKPMEAGDMKAMREALENLVHNIELRSSTFDIFSIVDRKTFLDAKAALSEPPRTGKWKNGKKYEYEYAYCSACGHMQWAGWDTHKQAEEDIENFAEVYKFCPNCGAKMEGGVYVK